MQCDRDLLYIWKVPATGNVKVATCFIVITIIASNLSLHTVVMVTHVITYTATNYLIIKQVDVVLLLKTRCCADILRRINQQLCLILISVS